MMQLRILEIASIQFNCVLYFFDVQIHIITISKENPADVRIIFVQFNNLTRPLSMIPKIHGDLGTNRIRKLLGARAASG